MAGTILTSHCRDGVLAASMPMQSRTTRKQVHTSRVGQADEIGTILVQSDSVKAESATPCYSPCVERALSQVTHTGSV